MLKSLTCAALLLAASTGMAFADGDAKAGAAVFKKCSACHTATEAKNKVGPSLMGVVGRKVASVDGFKYSEAMKTFGADGKVWDETHLTAYLSNPKAAIPKNKMAFAGLKKPEDILNLIAFLKDPAAAK
ncbi:cytochrome c family protein [Rhizobium sp. G21]|uniref:c-type cytochrome n=1 Tax=Rhizobium sp. G21 TaxID=2758439 RepID=UPI001601C379|nr:cytochrome c family protein [Rhizobium sp. G21]MBB1250389.1 cytochrome c family protein [Rhizobium sp. G21]